MDREKQERKIQKLMLPVETQILMCDDVNDVLLLAVGMLRKAIMIFENQYSADGRKALVDTFNK